MLDALRTNPALLKLDLYCRGVRLDGRSPRPWAWKTGEGLPQAAAPGGSSSASSHP